MKKIEKLKCELCLEENGHAVVDGAVCPNLISNFPIISTRRIIDRTDK